MNWEAAGTPGTSRELRIEKNWSFGSWCSKSSLLWSWQHLSTTLGTAFYAEDGRIYAKAKQNLASKTYFTRLDEYNQTSGQLLKLVLLQLTFKHSTTALWKGRVGSCRHVPWRECLLRRLSNCLGKHNWAPSFNGNAVKKTSKSKLQASLPDFLFLSWRKLENTNLVELQASKNSFDFPKHLQFCFMYIVRKRARKYKM